MNNNLFLSADDFENKRLNKSFFTNINKGISETQFRNSYPSDKFDAFEKGIVEGWIKDTFEMTGGEIVKGGFNDTEEVSKVLENLKNTVSLLKGVTVETSTGSIKEIFVMPKQEVKQEESTTGQLEKGKKLPIGTITNGYKKVSEGKWQKVSSHGLTKKEHNDKANESNKKLLGLKGKENANEAQLMAERASLQSKYANELDDKEYDDTHVENSGKLKKGKDADQLEKGKIKDALYYSELKIVFSKTGKEIKEKLATIKAKENSKLIDIEAKLSNLEDKLTHQPTEKYSYEDADDTYKTFKWEMTYVSENASNNNVVKFNDTDSGTLSNDECKLNREWNDLVYSYRDVKGEIDSINLLEENLEENKKYELTARQMLNFGF